MFFLFQNVPLKIKIFKKPDNMLEGNGWDMTQNMSKTGTFHVISGLYRDFPNFIFLTDFDA